MTGDSSEDRYRLYVDESGDHVFKRLDEVGHRYLCIVGCWFKNSDYLPFHKALTEFKQRHIPHNPDEPVVLHARDIMNRRSHFWRLRDPIVAERFDDELLGLIAHAQFQLVAVVIDKKTLSEQYHEPAHPYHTAMTFLLQRYCGLLNHLGHRGDVMAESRGRGEDQKLKAAYRAVYEGGDRWHLPDFYQRALTSSKLKVKPKPANISGLQLADVLVNSVRQSILIDKGLVTGPLSPFGAKLAAQIAGKYNRQLYDGRIDGYGKVFFPK